MKPVARATGLPALAGVLLLAAGCSQQIPVPTSTPPAPTAVVAPIQTPVPTRAAAPAPTQETGKAAPTVGVVKSPGAPQVPPMNVTPLPSQSKSAGSGSDLPDGAKALLEKAQADAAQRAGVAASEVTVAQVEAVDWRDGSLGCPQPGMMYPQVITPGYRFVLEAKGKRYEYHSDQGSRVILCEQAA